MWISDNLDVCGQCTASLEAKCPPLLVIASGSTVSTMPTVSAVAILSLHHMLCKAPVTGGYFWNWQLGCCVVYMYDGELRQQQQCMKNGLHQCGYWCIRIRTECRWRCSCFLSCHEGLQEPPSIELWFCQFYFLRWQCILTVFQALSAYFYNSGVTVKMSAYWAKTDMHDWVWCWCSRLGRCDQLNTPIAIMVSSSVGFY